MKLLFTLSFALFILFQDPSPQSLDYVEIEDETPDKMKVSGVV